MRSLVTAVLLLPVAVAAPAQSIFRCEGDDGEPVFSNMHCGGAATPVELGRDSVMNGSASLGGAREQLKRVQRMPEIRRDRRQRGSARMGFGERMERRRLQIRADGLRRDLLVPRSDSARAALQRELSDVSRRIKRLGAAE